MCTVEHISFPFDYFSNKVAVGVKTVTTVYGINQLQSYKIVSKKNCMNTFFGTKVFINQCIVLKFIFTTTFLKMFQVSIMISIKEERSRGTVD